MVRVSIDVAAANGVVASMRAFVDKVVDEWSTVGTSARNGLCSTAPLRALSDPLENVRRLARELTTRVELAVLYNTGKDGGFPTQPVLSYEVPDDTLDAVKAQLGIQIAKGLRNLAPGNRTPDRSDVERFERYTTLMEKYANDPVVTDALFDELGPQGVIAVPIMLKNLAAASANLTGRPDKDRMWDADTPMLERIFALQQRFLESFGKGLATSTHSAAFTSAHPDFAKKLAAVATEGRGGEGWGLSQVLRFGVYEPGFLTTIGTELYAFEKDQVQGFWGSQASGDVKNWRLGTEDDGGYYDPYVGLFGAMGRVPVAALDFFNPDGGGSGAQERAKYFIRDRTWSADDFNALGLALDAAATAFRTSTAPVDLQERAAWVASATVTYLAKRSGGINNQRIGDAGKDSLAHILSTYIDDVDRVANVNGVDKPPSTSLPGAMAPWEVGARVSAGFAIDDLRVVLGEVLTDDAAMSQIAEATARYNAYRMNAAVEAWNVDQGNVSRVYASVQTSAVLSGFVLGNLERASKAAGKSVDERNKAYLDIGSSVVGLIPTGGTFTSFVAKQALSAGKDGLSGAVTGNESAADKAAFDAQARTLADLRTAMTIALLGSPRITDAQKEYQGGGRLPWFDSTGAFVPSALDNPTTAEDFQRWITVGGGGKLITSNLPDLTVSYTSGIEKGKGPG